jgi:hypothetical protein
MKIDELRRLRFLTVEEVAALFREDAPWVYRNSSGRGCLSPARRKLNAKTLLFDAAEIERIINAAAEAE